MRIATIDVGTNAALLLVAEAAPGGGLRPVYTAERYIRLGAGVDARRRIAPEAMQRLRRTLLAYRDAARARGAEACYVTGTSASRDAENRAELAAYVRRETGLDYRILSGEEEARLSFLGVTAAFPDLDGPCVVVDVGGGSTEVVAGTPGAPPAYRCSLDVGAVRLTERYLAPPPAPPRTRDAAAACVRDHLSRVPPLPGPVLGAAGTTTALSHLYRPPARTVTAADVHAWRERLLALSPDAVLALGPGILAGRADVFPAGVLILDLLLEHLDAPACHISPWDLRHGLALHVFRTGTPPGSPP